MRDKQPCWHHTAHGYPVPRRGTAVTATMTWGAIWLAGVVVWLGTVLALWNSHVPSVPMLLLVLVLSTTLSAVCLNLLEKRRNVSGLRPRVRWPYYHMLALGTAWTFGIALIFHDWGDIYDGPATRSGIGVMLCYLAGIILVPALILAIRCARRWAGWASALYLGSMTVLLIMHGIAQYLSFHAFTHDGYGTTGQLRFIEAYPMLLPFSLTRLFLAGLALCLILFMRKDR